MQGKQISFLRYLISLLCVAILAAGGMYLYMTPATLTEETASEDDELAKVHALFHAIQDNYYKKVAPDTLIEGALAGMTDSLDDPYTNYLGKEDANSFTQSLSDSFEGIGATLSMIEEWPVVVQAPVKGSPAEKAGVKVDDKILEVDGEKTQGKTLNEVVALIRGEKGTAVTLVLQRGDTTFDVTITRDKIAVASIKSELDEKNATIGRIEIVSFSESTAKELKETIEKLRKEGALSFVIDVRQNPGGYLDQVEIMSSMFLKDGQTIVQFATGDEVIDKTVASKNLDDGFKVTEPTVVLVDSGSASAAEIFAAALKESANIPIIGTTTYGKGTVQNVSEFGDQSELKMTVQKWLTPNGEWLNETGLKPTTTVDLPDYAYLPPLSSEQVLKAGDESENVQNLNTFLKALGYTTNGNSFNEDTQKAVESFQKEHDLEVTGAMDSSTATAINKALFEQIQATDPIYDKAVDTLVTTN